jgi:hypothetical protein
MFYGAVLTHTIPRAHWEVIEEEYPLVRITTKTAVDVVRVAIRRLQPQIRLSRSSARKLTKPSRYK